MYLLRAIYIPLREFERFGAEKNSESGLYLGLSIVRRKEASARKSTTGVSLAT
jgi:hypothetical protein